MAIPEDPKEIIDRHWDAIQLLLLAKWDRLHQQDLWEIHHTMHDLIHLIQSKYKELPRESIIQDLENLIFQYKT